MNMIVPEVGGEFYLGNGVSSSMCCTVCIPPIRSGAIEAMMHIALYPYLCTKLY
jgi:hypothetical protein